MHLRSTSIIKITVKKMTISSECFVCFWWNIRNWKDQSFNITTGTEGITQLLKSNFEWFKCKWRNQCHAFAKKGTFFEHLQYQPFSPRKNHPYNTQDGWPPSKSQGIRAVNCCCKDLHPKGCRHPRSILFLCKCNLNES